MKDLSEDEENDIESDKSDNDLEILKPINNESSQEVTESVEKIDKIENKMNPKTKSENLAKFDEYDIDSSDEEVCCHLLNGN